MQTRVEKQLGVAGPKTPKTPPANQGMAGMTSSFGNAKSTVPNAPSTVGAGKMKMAQAGLMGTPPSMKPFLGGGETVKPRMAIAAKPKDPMIRYASPSIDECRAALGLDVRDTVQRLMTKEGQKARLLDVVGTLRELEASKDPAVKLACVVKLAELRKEAFLGAILRGAGKAMKSPLLWGGAGVLGAGLGIKKLVSSGGGAIQGIEAQRQKRLNTEPENLGQAGGY